MSAPDKTFFSRLLTEEPKLWQAIMTFYQGVCTQGPKSYAPLQETAALKEWFCSEKDSLRTRTNEQRFFWDFTEESRRLALLKDETMCALCRVFGVALHAKELARVVLKEERRALKETLGEALYSYALNRGQYQTGQVARLFALLDLDLDLGARCQLHGWQSLFWVAESWPKELCLPFEKRLKRLAEEALGKEVSFAKNARPQKPDELNQLFRALKKILLREVDSAWAVYFNSQTET